MSYDPNVPVAPLLLRPNALDVSVQQILDALPDPVFVKDREHRWVGFNEAFCQMLALRRDEMLGRSDFDFFAREEAVIFWAKDAEVFSSGIANTNLETHTDVKGRRRVIETKKSLMSGADGRSYLIGVIRDLTDLTAAKLESERSNRELELRIAERTEALRLSNAQLHNLAYIDSLTALANRRRLHLYLEQALGHGNPALFFMDVDHFKWINDSMGHPVGDQLLVTLAGRLRELQEFALIARIGGDEFVAIATSRQPPTDAHLATLARRLLSCVADPIQLGEQQMVVSGSIGIARAPRDGNVVHSLLQHADTAMYRAKDRGRNQFAFYTDEMGTRAQEHLKLESRLRLALSMDAITVALQPVFSASSGELTGYEALARWHDPELGEIPPERFIAIAEQRDLIHDLSRRVLIRAIAMVPASGRLAVNLSPLQLTRAEFPAEIASLLAQTGFDPRRLEFELTESSVTMLNETTLNVLEQLRALGASVALDDFGTGYSSLTLLQRLPIDRIKIDRSFVADLAQVRTAALVEAMISMAHALDLGVVAEGVETESQRQRLIAMKCDDLQGFLLGRPQQADPASGRATLCADADVQLSSTDLGLGARNSGPQQ
jgi:diguanylate cyclase (GGDEF)-like protein/PAS domain S-box-containing protein